MSIPEDVAEVLRSTSSATLSGFLGPSRIMDSDISPVAADTRVAGPAIPCYCAAGDNLPLHYAIDEAESGAVIVVASERRCGTGLWGALATRSAMARGIAGVVADGAVRDTDYIRETRFPVWCRFVSPLGARKLTAEPELLPEVVCGNVPVARGDFIVADADGVAVVPVELAEQAARHASERDELERQLAVQLDDGKSTLDVLNLRLEVTSHVRQYRVTADLEAPR